MIRRLTVKRLYNGDWLAKSGELFCDLNYIFDLDRLTVADVVISDRYNSDAFELRQKRKHDPQWYDPESGWHIFYGQTDPWVESAIKAGGRYIYVEA